MTVMELRDECDAFMRKRDNSNEIDVERANMDVIICDDWTPPKYFIPELVIGCKISVGVEPRGGDNEPPRFETRNVMLITTDLSKELQ